MIIPGPKGLAIFHLVDTQQSITQPKEIQVQTNSFNLSPLKCLQCNSFSNSRKDAWNLIQEVQSVHLPHENCFYLRSNLVMK